ncbi:MAG: hypothetical protein WC387_04080, partial [Candidatus Paceibacterota bacterium]
RVICLKDILIICLLNLTLYVLIFLNNYTPIKQKSQALFKHLMFLSGAVLCAKRKVSSLGILFL